MQTKYKVVVGSLAGAVAIHAALVACGRAARTGAQGVDGGLVDAMLDAISDVVGSETRDAVAADDSGACGCTVSGPIQNTPASENAAQLRTGNLAGLTAAGTIVIAGPFVLTDATTDSFDSTNNSVGATLVIQPIAATCPALTGAPDGVSGYVMSVQPVQGQNSAAHGGRYLIPAGQMLCAYLPPTQFAVTGGVQWAGFVPYS